MDYFDLLDDCPFLSMINHTYDAYEKEEEFDEEEYAEFIKDGVKCYAKQYAEEHLSDFKKDLESNGYDYEGFLNWDDDDRNEYYEDYFTDMDDYEEYIKEMEEL